MNLLDAVRTALSRTPGISAASSLVSATLSSPILTPLASSPSPCPWCSNLHPTNELCRAKRVSRRTFLITASAATAGAMLPLPQLEPPFLFSRIHPDDAFEIRYNFAMFVADRRHPEGVLFTAGRRAGKSIVALGGDVEEGDW